MDGLDLDPGTKQLIAEAFAGKVCDVCGAPACKLANDTFFCRQCVRPSGTAPEEYAPPVLKTLGLMQSPIRRKGGQRRRVG
jgi:hypothetical protein